jgi:hypothetical protein
LPAVLSRPSESPVQALGRDPHRISKRFYGLTKPPASVRTDLASVRTAGESDPQPEQDRKMFLTS